MSQDQSHIQSDAVTGELRAFVVPFDILTIPDLTIYELAAYTVLRAHCNPTGETAFPSYQTIADMARMSRRQAMRAVESLIEKGLVTKTPRDFSLVDGGRRVSKNKSNLYHVKNPKVVSDSHQLQSSDYQSPVSTQSGVHQSPVDVQSGDQQSLYKDSSSLKDKDSLVVVKDAQVVFDQFKKQFPSQPRPWDEVLQRIIALLQVGYTYGELINGIEYASVMKADNPLAYFISATVNGWQTTQRIKRGKVVTEPMKTPKSKPKDERYAAFYQLFPDA